MWLRDPSLHELMKTWWNEVRGGHQTCMFLLRQKLAHIKNKLKDWNRERFGNIFINKAHVEGELSKINEKFIEKGMDEADFDIELQLKSELKEILAREEIFWRQKSRGVWLKEGDKNTKFFHKTVNINKARRNITEIVKEDGLVMQNTEEVNQAAAQYFQSILNRVVGDNRRERELFLN